MKHTLIGVVSAVVAVAALVAAFAVYLKGTDTEVADRLRSEVATARATYEEIARQQQVFGDFTTQDVTSYIGAVRAKMRLLLAEKELIVAEQNLSIDPDYIVEKNGRINQIESELSELGIEAGLMNYVHIDWTEIQTHPDRKEALANFWKYWAKRSWPVSDEIAQTAEQNSSEIPAVRISKNQIIGLQGCSGVCSGTHLHFVTIYDNQYRDPCNLLPKRRFTKWGVNHECGTELSTDLIWPQAAPWLITQEFGDVSPVTGTVHNAIDIIDRVEAPVVAAHDGWYYTYYRSCYGASICNGQTQVALVCEQQGCESGLVTEYWHMDWMMEGPTIGGDLVSEYRDRYGLHPVYY